MNPDACNKGDTGEASGMIVILCSVLFKSCISLVLLYYEFFLELFITSLLVTLQVRYVPCCFAVPRNLAPAV